MSKQLAVSALPADVLNEFHHRLCQSDFSDYEGHAAWLQSKGFQISRSAAHRHGQENEGKIRNAQLMGEMPASVEVRLRCLEAAIALKQAQSPAEILKHANEFLKWVHTF